MKTLPLDVIGEISKIHKTFHLYDADSIIQTCKKLYSAFEKCNYTNFFAVKANPNPEIMKILLNEGMGLDCSSLGELVLAERVSASGDQIMFTSNNTKEDEFIKAAKMGARITFDDIDHIEFYQKCLVDENMLNIQPFTGSFACRYNPGDSISFDNSDIIGDPKESKFGMTRDQLFQAYSKLREYGVSRFGFHCMMISNELDPSVFLKIISHVSDLVGEIQKMVGITFEYINLGGGLGIPYRPDQKEIDLSLIAPSMKELAERYHCRIFQENGRYIVGPSGILVSYVTHVKTSYKKYIGIDANMCDLMRPGMYGAYHHIEFPFRTGQLEKVDVIGSLCENNDKFAVDRMLPSDMRRGDLCVIHCTGAHGYCMGNNYNGKLKHAEYLYNGKDYRLIRKEETFDHLYWTLCEK